MARPQARVLLLALLLGGLALWLLRGDDEDEFSLPQARDRAAARSDESLEAQPTLQAAQGAAARKSSVPGASSEAPSAPATALPPSEPAGPEAPLKLRVDVVHAFTGMDVSARWNLYPGPLDARGRPHPIDSIQRSIAGRKRREWEDQLVEWRRKFVPSGDTRVIDRKATQSFPPLVLEGIAKKLVPWRPPESLRTEVAAGVSTLVALVPVAPGVDLNVLIREQGTFLSQSELRRRDVRVTQLTVGGEDWPFLEVVPRGLAVLQVLGIPHLAGEPVTAHVVYEKQVPPQTEGAPAPEPTRRLPNLRTLVPQDVNDSWTVEVPTPVPPDELEPKIKVDADLAAVDVARGDDDVLTEMRLRVLGWDGRPLPLRDLEGLPVDDQGRLVRENEPTGLRDLRVTLPGRLPIEAHLDVKAGAVFEATLREPEGAQLEVFVVNELGEVRPSATLSLPGRRWFDVDGTVQRIDSLTDHLGRRRFARVEAGRVTVHARWGSRHGAEEVNLVDGHLTRITVVAR